MTLYLYNYSAERNIVNKFSTDIQLIKSLEVEMRTPFTPLAPVFTIGEYVSANYCRFTYHDIIYCCFCDISNLSDGLFQVNCYIDALTTAHENQCMNGVQCKMLYSKQGDAFLPDPRITLNGVSHEYTVSDRYSELPYYVLIVANYGNNMPTPNTVYSSTTAYIMDRQGYQTFWNMFTDLPEVRRGQIVNSIVNTYWIHYITNVSILNNRADSASGVTLYGVINSTAENVVTTSETLTFGTNSGKVWRYAPGKLYSDISLDLTAYNIKLSPYDAMKNVEFTMAGIGTVSFTPSAYGITEVDNIGFRIYYDLFSASYVAELGVNNKRYPAQCIVAPITEMSPILYESSVNNFRSALFQSASTIVSGNDFNMSPKALVGAVSKGIASQTLMYAEKLTESPRVGALHGNLGGNPYFTREYLMYFVYRRQELSTDRTAMKNLFGAPDGEIRYILNMQGYFQTGEIHLNTNGLPVAIVTSAENEFQQGVKMV